MPIAIALDCASRDVACFPEGIGVREGFAQDVITDGSNYVFAGCPKNNTRSPLVCRSLTNVTEVASIQAVFGTMGKARRSENHLL